MSFYLLMAIFGIPSIICIIWVPIWQVRKAKISNSERWKAENEFRKTLVQIVGGIFLLCSLFFAWEQLNQFYISQENMKSDQISSRYSKAVELLAGEKSTTRIGAIYAMEQIVGESSNYLRTVIDVLSEFVRNSEYRENDEGDELINQEVQSAMTVIGRIRSIDDIQEEKTCAINLANAKLKGVNLGLANLSNAELSGVELSSSNLSGANLKNANLKGADLRRTNLKGAKLEEVNFSLTNLSNAEMTHAELLRADLSGAILQGVNLEKADLQIADLDGADLRRSNLSGARLDGASMWYTNLELARGITLEQLLKVKTLFQVRGLDSVLREKLIKMKPGLFEHPDE